MKLFWINKTGRAFTLVIGLMVATLALAACGDKISEVNTLSAGPNTQPGTNWQFQGKVDAIGSPWWTVNQQRILVNDTTSVDSNPTPVVGSQVQVQGHTEDGGVLAASTIKVVVQIGVPTVTPSGTVATTPTGTIIATATGSVSPQATATATPAATNAPQATATPVPATAAPAPGTTINIVGVIQQVVVNNNQTIVVIDNRQYILAPNIVAVIKPRLVVGVPINFVGRYEDGGTIIIINVTKINNQVIVINNPVLVNGGDDNKDNPGDDHKSNGNCEGHSNGNCQGDKDKGKDNGKKPKK